MNRLVKKVTMLSVLAAALAGTSMSTVADDERTMPHMGMMGGGSGYGYGPGMMGGGYGPGPGYGTAYGTGATMGGYGPGMTMGPGMMGGYGPGMMMGPGMMGGYGPGMMMGHGMMGGYGMGHMAMYGLSDEQTAKLDKVADEMTKKQTALMEQMWEEQQQLWVLYNAQKRDPSALSKAYDKVSKLHRQMFDLHNDTRKKVDALLTDEQKARMRHGFGWGMMGY